MSVDETQFLHVPLNINIQTACSPKPPGPHWRGILIQAPRLVRFRRGTTVGNHGAFAAIPVCGYYLLDVPPRPTTKCMRLVAVDNRTCVFYSGEIVELDDNPDDPLPGEPSPPEKRQGLAAGGFFNPNLADFVGLPVASAIYDVHVEFRGYRSNEVTIELVEA